ncbi:cold shock domain-containing protein [Sporobolomyces salmoneus]|uniref:cold shock domain-containing protein n=1 Tax=Sporobolomyces salmoneus TaxID=183962 RepID=UPI003172705E
MAQELSGSTTSSPTTGDAQPEGSNASSPTSSALSHHSTSDHNPARPSDSNNDRHTSATASTPARKATTEDLPPLPQASPPPNPDGKLESSEPLELQMSALGLLGYEDLSGGRTAGPSGGGETGKRRQGTTKFFNASKGFGFIFDHDAEELGNAEVFVHYTAIQSVQGGSRAFKSLLEGEEVSYYVTQGPKGWQAQDVTGPDGGPCIGTSPSTNSTRSLYTFPRSGLHHSSNLEFRGGTAKTTRFDRNSQHGPRSGSGRGNSDFRPMGMTSPRDNYSNLSSPPSQASSQLPATPQTPHYYPLPATPTTPMMMYPGMHQPLYFPQHDPNQAPTYYPPPPPLPSGAPPPPMGYYPPPQNVDPMNPFLVQSSQFPPPPLPPPATTMNPLEQRPLLPPENNSAYPISSIQQPNHSTIANSKPSSMMVDSFGSESFYNVNGAPGQTEELRSAAMGYPISSRAS